MKLDKSDIPLLRGALMASRMAGLDSVVISEGKLRGLGTKANGAIFSTLALSIDPEIEIGITRLQELEKRLSLFGDEVSIEGEVTDAKKTRKLTIKGARGKIEFRCTDSKLIKYPKTNPDVESSIITLTKPEIALISKGIRTLGAEQVAIQIKRDGGVHIECVDTNNDRFETDLESPAEFLGELIPSVTSYDTTGNGVFLTMLEHMAKDADKVDLVVMKSGNVSMTCFGHNAIAIPRIDLG